MENDGYPHLRMPRHDPPPRLVSFGILAALILIAIAPVIVVFAHSVFQDGRFTGEAYRGVLAQPRQWSLLRNTLVIASATAFLATLLGVPAGFALEYLRPPGRRLLAYATALPLLTPPYMNAIVWADILSRRNLLRFGLNPAAGDGPSPLSIYSAAGVVFVLALSYYPVVAFATAVALRRYDRRLEEPARLAGSRWSALRHVTWPLVAPSAFIGTVIVFIFGLVEFSVPSLLQVNVYTVSIYERFSATYDARAAAAQAVPLLACGGLALVTWASLLRSHRGRLTGTRRTPARSASGIADWGAALFCALLVGLASLLPLSVLFFRSLPLSSYAEVWRTAHEELTSSLLVATASATALTALAAAMACLARWRRPTAGLYRLSLLGFLVSGPLLGVGLILVWNRPGPPAWVYDSGWILVVACTARFLFFAHEALFAAQNSLSRKLDEAAAVHGVPRRRQAMGILLPLLAPVLVAVWGFSFLLSFRELDAAVLVTPPGWNTIAVRLFGLMHYGPSRLVAALSVITLSVTLGGAALTAGACACAWRMIDARR